MTTAHGDGRALAYDVAGAPGAPAVVLLHGLSGARAAWSEIVPRLTDRYRVFVPDQRGHGESARAPGEYRLEHYGADAVAFVEDVIGGPAAFVGHSLGGLVVAHLAGTRPDLVRCAFLEDPPLYLGEPDTFASTIFAVFFPLVQQMLRDMRARMASVDEFESVIRALPTVNAEAAGGGSADQRARRQAVMWHSFDPEAFSPAIDGSLFAAYDPSLPIPCPVRLLRAERDLGAAFFPEHEAAFVATHRRAEVELVAGASHLIHEEDPERFATDVHQFLARHVGTR